MASQTEPLHDSRRRPGVPAPFRNPSGPRGLEPCVFKLELVCSSPCVWSEQILAPHPLALPSMRRLFPRLAGGSETNQKHPGVTGRQSSKTATQHLVDPLQGRGLSEQPSTGWRTLKGWIQGLSVLPVPHGASGRTWGVTIIPDSALGHRAEHEKTRPILGGSAPLVL